MIFKSDYSIHLYNQLNYAFFVLCWRSHTHSPVSNTATFELPHLILGAIPVAFACFWSVFGGRPFVRPDNSYHFSSSLINLMKPHKLFFFIKSSNFRIGLLSLSFLFHEWCIHYNGRCSCGFESLTVFGGDSNIFIDLKQRDPALIVSVHLREVTDSEARLEIC